MKLTRVGALAASAVFVFAACNSGARRAGRPAMAVGPPRSPKSAMTRRAPARTRSTCTRRCRARARTRPRPNTLVESITEILADKVVGDYTIKYTDLDDSSAANNGDWDGAVAQQNATTAANDPDAMVFIGHFNSGAAKLTIPILNNACLVMISPANTYPGLTTAVEGVTEPGEPDSYYPNGYRNYSRVISTDDKQGGAGAAWAKELGATKAYVLDDTQVYGKGLARAWALFANELGIEVVSAGGTSEGFDAKATDYAALAQKIKDSGADFIYIGSITGQNTGKLWKDLRAAMPDIKIMSGDGVFEEAWYEGTGEAGNGTYLTFGGVGPNEQTSDAGKEWVADYKAAHDGEDPPVYGIYGAAAAQVALDALTRAGDQRPLGRPQGRLRDDGLRLVSRQVLDQAGRRYHAGRGDRVPGHDSWPPKFEKVLAAPE